MASLQVKGVIGLGYPVQGFPNLLLLGFDVLDRLLGLLLGLRGLLDALGEIGRTARASLPESCKQS